jgi:hypothetical protein
MKLDIVRTHEIYPRASLPGNESTFLAIDDNDSKFHEQTDVSVGRRDPAIGRVVRMRGSEFFRYDLDGDQTISEHEFGLGDFYFMRGERIAGRANDFHARYQLDLKNNRCTVHTRQLTFCEKLSWRALPSTVLGAGVGAAVALLGSLGGLPVAGAALAGGLTGLWLWQALKAPSLQSFPE